jgi:gag-polypeptide of LTR copia-type
LNSSDDPGMMINSCVFKRGNYDTWVKAMENALRAKSKLGFVDGFITKLNAGEPEAGMWEIYNSTTTTTTTKSLIPNKLG